MNQQIPVTFEAETVGFVQSLETVGDRAVGTVSISSEAANKLMNEMLGTVVDPEYLTPERLANAKITPIDPK